MDVKFFLELLMFIVFLFLYYIFLLIGVVMLEKEFVIVDILRILFCFCLIYLFFSGYLGLFLLILVIFFISLFFDKCLVFF